MVRCRHGRAAGRAWRPRCRRRGAARQLAGEADAAVDGGRAARCPRRRCGRSPRPGSPARGWEPGSGRGCAAAAAAGARRGGGEALQHRQHEGGRLAGAGLGAGQQVTAGEDERNRLALDGGWFGVALRRDGAEQVGRQARAWRRTWEAPDEALPLQMRGPVRARVGSGSGRSNAAARTGAPIEHVFEIVPQTLEPGLEYAGATPKGFPA